MKKRYLALSTTEGQALVTLVKSLFNFEDFTTPAYRDFESLCARVHDTSFFDQNLAFTIWNNGDSGFKLDLETMYTRVVLCMLHTNDVHTNQDGTIIDEAHLHLYQEGKKHYDAIPFLKYLSNPDEIGTCIIDFLKYCGVANYSELPIQFELL